MLKVENLSKSFGETQVLQEISFNVEESSITACLGPSGYGKTTLLRILAGLIEPTEGKYTIDREFGMVFQEPRLLPWMNVEENVALSQELSGDKVSDDQLNKALELVELFEFRKSYPQELSGGMKQRVSFARALNTDPDFIFLDEPFSSLDYGTKNRLKKRFLSILEKEKMGALYVTHDIEDALDIADRLILLGGQPTEVIKNVDTSSTSKEELRSLYLDL